MLSQIAAKHFRNLKEQTIYPAQDINLVIGENGSGKTSLLEAVYLIAMGRSFRSRQLKNLIQYDQSGFTLFAKTQDQIPIGFQYSLAGGLQFKLNGAPLKRLSDLAAYVPLQLIPSDSHQLFESGPKFRRKFLDWGVFHVKRDFNFHWQSYKKALLQRNAAIKKHCNNAEISLWDQHLQKHGDELSHARLAYLQQLLEHFTPVFTAFCPEYVRADFELRFNRGWKEENDLDDLLVEQLPRDKFLGYTRTGAHSADWTIKTNDLDPKDNLSRGQQKLFYLALCIAQIELIKKHSKTGNTILLIDDISSELDQGRQLIVLQMLHKIQAQVFISSTNVSLQQSVNENSKVFHVKQGEVLERASKLS